MSFLFRSDIQESVLQSKTSNRYILFNLIQTLFDIYDLPPRVLWKEHRGLSEFAVMVHADWSCSKHVLFSLTLGNCISQHLPWLRTAWKFNPAISLTFFFKKTHTHTIQANKPQTHLGTMQGLKPGRRSAIIWKVCMNTEECRMKIQIKQQTPWVVWTCSS